LFAAPSTVESPFSKEELVTIISDSGYLISNSMNNNELRKSIIAKANHLLTNANEFPCLMEVSHNGQMWQQDTVIGFYNGHYLVVDEIDCEYKGYKHARPIEQKPKELKDLKEGDKIWCVKSGKMDSGSNKGKECFTFGKDYELISCNHADGRYHIVDSLESDHFLNYQCFNEFFSPYPPTPEQFTAAEEAAINEVKQRFDKARKEVDNG